MVNISKPYSNEEVKLPKDFTAENRTKQKGAGWKDTLELASGPIEPWAMGTGRAGRSQGCVDNNESEIPGRTLVKNEILAVPMTLLFGGLSAGFRISGPDYPLSSVHDLCFW